MITSFMVIWTICFIAFVVSLAYTSYRMACFNEVPIIPAVIVVVLATIAIVS